MVDVPDIDGPREQAIKLDGEPLQLRELLANDLLAVWGMLEKAEQTGDMTDAYLRVVARGVFLPTGAPRWESVDEVARLPARIVVDLAERILFMSEVGLNPEVLENPTGPPKT